eukprot:scaffold40463_cov53-Phaeocystis_antarctica.AAC.3
MCTVPTHEAAYVRRHSRYRHGGLSSPAARSGSGPRLTARRNRSGRSAGPWGSAAPDHRVRARSVCRFVGGQQTRMVFVSPLCEVLFTRPTCTSPSESASCFDISSHIGFICAQLLQPVTANMTIVVRPSSCSCQFVGCSGVTLPRAAVRRASAMFGGRVRGRAR